MVMHACAALTEHNSMQHVEVAAVSRHPCFRLINDVLVPDWSAYFAKSNRTRPGHLLQQGNDRTLHREIRVYHVLMSFMDAGAVFKGAERCTLTQETRQRTAFAWHQLS
jgi:hypothetical protein